MLSFECTLQSYSNVDASVLCRRFACRSCSACPPEMPTRCLDPECMATVCGECASVVNFSKCPVCSKRTRASHKRQLQFDYVLNDALWLAFPQIKRARYPNENVLLARAIDDVLLLAKETATHEGVLRQKRNDAYLEEVTCLVKSHTTMADLLAFVRSHMCECTPSHMCVPRVSKDGSFYMSCPAFCLESKRRSGRSKWGCSFYRKLPPRESLPPPNLNPTQ